MAAKKAVKKMMAKKAKPEKFSEEWKKAKIEARKKLDNV